jgi:hypothetical protein
VVTTFGMAHEMPPQIHDPHPPQTGLGAPVGDDTLLFCRLGHWVLSSQAHRVNGDPRCDEGHPAKPFHAYFQEGRTS